MGPGSSGMGGAGLALAALVGAIPALPLPTGVSSSHLGPELPHLKARYCLPPVIALRICVYT